MLSHRLFTRRGHLLLTQSMFSSLRCVSAQTNISHGQKFRRQRQKSVRKPVPFGLATSIHATMVERLQKKSDEGTSPASGLGDKFSQETKGDNTELSEAQWQKELEELSKTMEQLSSNTYRTSETVFVLEEKLRQRIGELGLQKSLQVADVFFSHRYRQKNFLTYLFEHVVQKDPSSVPALQVTHLMFYVFFHGSAPPAMYYQLEDYLTSSLDQFDVNDIGIICLGYFRGNKRIQSHDLLDKMSERVLEDFNDLKENMLINILKTFRHAGFAKISFFETLADKLLESSLLQKSSSLNSLMHIAMTYACNAMCCKKLNQELLSCFGKLVQKYHGTKDLRSKDIAKFVWATGTFVHEPDKERSTYMKLVEAYCSVNLDQEKEHPQSLADMLQGLTYLGIHPHHLFQRILEPKTAKSLKDSAVYGKVFQLLLFHNTILIECPQYKGKLLSKGFLRSLYELPGMTGDLDFEMKTRKGLQPIYQTLEDIFGSNKVKVHFILPHFTLADIEMRLDDHGQPVEFTATPFTSKLRAIGSIQAAVTDDLVSSLAKKSGPSVGTNKIAIEILGHNQHFANTKELTGNILAKLRQLRSLGYHVILIPAVEASKLCVMSEEDRRHYLSQKLHKEVGVVLPTK